VCARRGWPPGSTARLTTCESSTNAVWVPTLAAVKSAQNSRCVIVELHGDDVLAALLIEPRVGALDLLTADDRLVQQIDLFVVL